MKLGWRLATAAMALMPALATSAKVELQDQTLVVSGELVVEDEATIIAAFMTGHVRVVRFEDCLGGAFGAQETLERFIATNETPTEGKGLVASACAFAFMAGSSRTLLPSSGNDTQLAFHAPVSSLNGVLSSNLAELLRQKLIERSGGRISPAVAAMMVPPDNAHTWFRVFLNPGQVRGQTIHVVYCRDNDPENPACDGFTGADASTLGLVTVPSAVGRGSNR